MAPHTIIVSLDTLKRECHDNQWFFFSHFVWGKIMAATRKDRGNSWASRARAPLNDDRAPIVAKLVEATFSSWACSWGPGGCFVACWLVDSLYPPPNCGLERTSRFRRWHRPSKDLFRGVVSGVSCFFFRLFHDFLQRTLIVIKMIYERRYGWHKDVFILSKNRKNKNIFVSPIASFVNHCFFSLDLPSSHL